MNKETLEDVIYKIFKSKNYSNLESNPNAIGFMIAGAQEGANWQSERMYSEEEVLEIVQTFNDVCERPNKPHQIKNWFEQFKKK